VVALAAKLLLVVGTLSAIAWVWWADEGAAWWTATRTGSPSQERRD